MTEKLWYVFLGFMALVMLNYMGTVFFNAIGPLIPGSPAAAAGRYLDDGPAFLSSGNGGASAGLSSIDFSVFDNNGGRQYISQGYGRTAYAYLYVNNWHNGIDIAAKYGAPIHSPSDGIILATGNQDNYCYGKGFGKFIAVKDDKNNLVLWYAHLGQINVSPGDVVKKDEVIGSIGTTGLETGPHLHFSVFDANGFSIKPKYGCGPSADGKDLNPLSYLGSTYK